MYSWQRSACLWDAPDIGIDLRSGSLGYQAMTGGSLCLAVATFDLVYDNTTSVCMPYLVPPAPPPPSPDASAPGVTLAAPAPAEGNNGGLIGGVVGGVVAAAAIAAGIVAFFLLRKRRRRDEEAKALEDAKVKSSHTVRAWPSCHAPRNRRPLQ
jgi:hypothetical protein